MRELAIACACHLVVRLALRTARFATLVRFSRSQLPRAPTPLSFSRLQYIARLSRRLCRGSCLSESLVFRLLAARHGFGDVPVTIGVGRAEGAFRAHAWAGTAADANDYTPIWLDASGSTLRGTQGSNPCHETHGAAEPRGGR
jgi:hypothetical protein